MQDAAVDVTVYLLAARPGLLSPALLAPSELRRSEAFARDDDGRDFTAAHTLLRLAAADHLAVPPSALGLDFRCARCGDQHGPPRIPAGPGAGVALSLTRSSGLVAVALLGPATAAAAPASPSMRVGVDVERLDAVAFPGFDDVALSAAERRWLAVSVGGRSAAADHPGGGRRAVDSGAGLGPRAALWVRKEAVAKALGSGLRRDPRSLEVLAGGPESKGDSVDGRPGGDMPRSSGEAVVEGRSVAWCDVPVGHGGFVAAVAVAGAAPGTIIRVTVRDAGPLFDRYRPEASAADVAPTAVC